MKYIILGTAGHIDHGKSTLVKALTGTDPDRLKEEKERGITLDLGFASLDLPGGNRLGIVDVPGHEGLIKNMLAGVGGIDIVMLVIAADEGIMPQTREHLAICDLLQVKKGIIVLTKMDMVEKDWLALVQDEVRDFVKSTFLEKSPIVPVSSKTGENLQTLVQELAKLSNDVAPKSSNGILRLPIDRVFTMKGFGTVITGTLLSGTISTEQEVEILPKGIKTKVRGIQSHNQAVSRSVAGQRTAVNLQGIEKDQLSRGRHDRERGVLCADQNARRKARSPEAGPAGAQDRRPRAVLQHDPGSHRQDHAPRSKHARSGRGSIRADTARTPGDRPARRPVHPALLFSHGDPGRRHGAEPSREAA